MRLIDADAIHYCSYDLDNYHSFSAVTDDDIAEMPTIDAVEVVRCKDCKYGEYDYTECFGYYECRYVGGDWNKGEHFCSYGERRKGE